MREMDKWVDNDYNFDEQGAGYSLEHSHHYTRETDRTGEHGTVNVTVSYILHIPL